MKKVFKFMMMALVAIVMSAGFAACSSSDDDNNTPVTPGGGTTPDTPAQNKETYLQIKVNINDELLSVADVTVEYTGEDGSTKTESMTTTSFEKKVVYTNNPSSVFSNVKFKLKENYPAKDKYNFEYSNAGTEAFFNGVSFAKGGTNSFLNGVKPTGIADVLKNLTAAMKFSAYK